MPNPLGEHTQGLGPPKASADGGDWSFEYSTGVLLIAAVTVISFFTDVTDAVVDVIASGRSGETVQADRNATAKMVKRITNPISRS